MDPKAPDNADKNGNLANETSTAPKKVPPAEPRAGDRERKDATRPSEEEKRKMSGDE